jgi:hypothetical protein
MSRRLEAAGMVETTYNAPGVGPTLFGRNGEGDRYFTDGEIQICVLVVDGKVRKESPVSILSPAAISFKDQAFWMIASSK